MRVEASSNLKALGVCLVALILLVIISAMAKGQESSICQIWVHDRDGQGKFGGTGTLLHAMPAEDGKPASGLVITCWHLFRDSPGARIEAIFPDGRTHEALLLGSDEDNDLAALKIGNPRSPALGIGSFDPSDTFRTGGYGSSSQPFRLTSGTRHPTQLVGHFCISTNNRQGDSGGPLLNSKNQVVGVAWGGNDGYVATCQYNDLLAFTRQWNVCGPGGCGPSYVARPAQSARAVTIDRNPPVYLAPPPKPAYDAKAAIEELLARIDYLDQELAACKNKPPAKDGVDGKDGQDGTNGKDAVFDIASLPPITFRYLDSQGQPSDTETVHLGGTLDIAPMRVVRYFNGEVIGETSVPIGGLLEMWEKNN